jgi:hypothetical protein
VILWLAACASLPPSAHAQAADTKPAVKMSRSGICHERGSVHHRQTIYFESFPSLEACLAAGGRPMGGEAAVGAPTHDYRGTRPPRNYWPHAIIVAAVGGAQARAEEALETMTVERYSQGIELRIATNASYLRFAPPPRQD